MSQAEQFEIDELLSQIADEGASREAVERLGALLLDRPDLQEHYSQAIRLHMLLTHEMSLSSPTLKPVIPSQDCQFARELNEDCSANEALMASLGGDALLSNELGGHRHWTSSFMVGTAAIVTFLAVGFGIWLSGNGFGDLTASRHVAAVLPEGSDHNTTFIDGSGLMVRDVRTMKVLSRLTRTSLLTSMLLPHCHSSDTDEITLCSGVAWMERSPGNKERGYLLALPPGTMMDLYVDTDAEDENALAVVEIDPFGRMTGGTISFSNVKEGSEDTTKRRAGCIGNYSVFNDTSFTKYFLFAGSHVLPRQAADESWYQSDYRVQYESEDLLVIGWDDSGYSGVAQPTYGDFTPDLDYNDIRAILHFSRPGELRKESTDIEYHPQPLRNGTILDESKKGYIFDVKPGEQVLILVSASARLPNSMHLIELPSRQILWKLTGVDDDGSLSQDVERGILSIRNNSDTVRQYQLYGSYQPGAMDGDNTWQAMPERVVAESDGSLTVGYEDSIGISKNVDWNDIRVHARWFSD